MKSKIFLLLLSLSCFTQVSAQKTDTVFWYHAANRYDLVGIKEIILTINDSTFKSTNYFKGKVTAVKYTGIVNGCRTPIQTDTLFDRSGGGVRVVIENEVQMLHKSTNCDSLLLVQRTKVYSNNGQLSRTASIKRIGQFGDCPCGAWKYYSDGAEIAAQEFASCYDDQLSNLDFVETVWSPNLAYKLELYKEKMLIAAPGGGSDHMATIILKDKDDKVVSYVSSNSSENIMYRDIEIRWEMEKERVWYGKARILYFKE